MKIYFVRHQAAGYMTKYPFLTPPNDKQIAAVVKECFRSFGFGHAKTPGEPYWVQIAEFEALGADEVPVLPERTLSMTGVKNEAAVAMFGASGTGNVSSP